jgi:hypothetical protein
MDACMRLLVTDDDFQIRPTPPNNPGWQINLDCHGHPVEVRPVDPGESLEPIFRLVYDVYVEEKGVLRADALSAECRKARAKWDDWDFLPCTRHFVALINGVIIGHTRVVNDSAIGVPLERTGFDLGEERALGRQISEFSKLIIRRQYRGTPILSALLWQVFQQKKVLDGQPYTYFSCEPAFSKVYRRMGGTEMGAFFSNEFKVMYSAMRLVFGSSFNEHAIDGPRMHLKQHALLSCVSTTQLQRYADRLDLDLAIESWQSRQLASGGAEVAGVWRVSASGKDSRNVTRDWSCVAKTIIQGGSPVRHELATYRDGAALPAPTRLKMPQLLDIIHGDGADTLILEDVSDRQTRPLQVSDLPDLAEELGRWHGAGMHRRDNIARGWLRGYVREAEPLVAAFPEYRRQTPLLESLFTEPVHYISSGVWANRQLLLNALDALPQVYSHQDLVANNVAVREGAQGRSYYLLDWDIAGMAPVGAELAPLLVGSAILMRWDIQASTEVLDDVIDAYSRGLLSKGVHIDMDTLRLSFSLSAAVRYLAWAGHRVGSVMDPTMRRMAQTVTGHSLPEIIANYSAVRERLAAWGLSAIAAVSPSDIAVRA